MSYHDFIRDLAGRTGLTQIQVRQLLAEFAAAIQAQALIGEEVSIPRLGIFHPKRRRARRIRDIATGHLVDLPERSGVGFRASKRLKWRTR